MSLQVAISQQTLIDVQSDPNLFLLIHDGNKIQIGSVIELVLMEDNQAKPLDPPFMVKITRLNKYGLKPEQVQIFFDRYLKPIEEPKQTFIGDCITELKRQGFWFNVVFSIAATSFLIALLSLIKCH